MALSTTTTIATVKTKLQAAGFVITTENDAFVTALIQAIYEHIIADATVNLSTGTIS